MGAPRLDCSGTLLVDRTATGASTLRVRIAFASRRVRPSGEPLDERCLLTRDLVVPLGDPSREAWDFAANLERLFGSRFRAVGELGASTHDAVGR